MQLTPARGVFGDEPVWFHEPARWRRSGPDIVLTADPGTDFWRHTHYGHVHDNGHFLGARMLGDFVASASVDGRYRTGGDQAGLMVRMDAERWITAAVELVDGGAPGRRRRHARRLGPQRGPGRPGRRAGRAAGGALR